MPQTPNENLPYPAPADPCDVPEDLKRLASRTDDVITLLRNQVAAIEPGITESDADDRYVNVDGDTMTGDLILDSTGGTVRLRMNHNGATKVMWQNNANDDVTSIVTGTFQTVLAIRSDGVLSADRATSFIVPAPTADNHAARKQDVDGKINKGGDTVTGVLIMPIPKFPHQPPRLARAPDETTGDLGLPGFAGSDTGWRDVQGDAINGWTPSVLAIRRFATTVELEIQTAPNQGITAALDCYEFPVGFQCNKSVLLEYRHPRMTGSLDLWQVGKSQAGKLKWAGGAMNAPCYLRMAFTTTQDWPSTLPGTEVTPPVKWS